MNCGTQIKPLSKLKKTWKPAKKCDRTELLQLHRPTSLSKLKNTIPRPKCRPIKDDLPFWEIRELNEKIPMYHGYVPSGRIVLHRGLMGNNFHKTNVKLNFSLSDPYCRDVSYAYNALHDPHLKHWSTSNKNRKFLQQQGLITEDMDVICSLKEYNEFRYYLWRVHNDLILQQLKLEEEKKVERKKILDANLNHQNEILKKLKRLKYAMSKKELKNSSKPNSKKSKDPVLKKEFNKSFKVKKIETCTVYGKKKNGMIDQAQYKGTFIKGTPDDFNLLGFYNNFFNQNKK